MMYTKMLNYSEDAFLAGKDEDRAVIKEYALESLGEIVAEETDFARCGPSTADAYVLIGESLFYIEIALEWNRYDKMFYYLDGQSITKWEEIL